MKAFYNLAHVEPITSARGSARPTAPASSPPGHRGPAACAGGSRSLTPAGCTVPARATAGVTASGRAQ